MQDIEIVASSLAVPKQVVSNDELTHLMDTSDEWIVKRTGIKRRHLSQGENTSDLASQTAQQLLNQAGVQASDLDLIIVATMSPDSMTPATAAIVQGKIGAERAIAFDISAACSGFSYAMSIARSLLLTNNFKIAIVIGAEILSKLIDWHDRSTAVLFGDGSGGVLVKKSADKHFLGQDLATFGKEGSKLTAGQIDLQADFTQDQHQLSTFQMAGRDVYRFATHQVPNSILRASGEAGIELDQIDHFLLHQANYRIIEHVAKKLGQPLTKFPVNIAEYGNTAAASEAILLAECIKKKIVKKSEIVALSGFGGGLTVATIIFKL